jgi:hypothetical protein
MYRHEEDCGSESSFDLNDFAQEVPDMADLGSERFVQFPVRRVRNASVAYLNAAWFLAHGLDLDEPGISKSVHHWLLQNYGVSVPQFPNEDESDYEPGELFMNADRYGSTGGALHGGSGRCGTRGRFNAKGVGRTPLVSPGEDWYHSHGCMWLEEAIREATHSSVLMRESPISVQPIIAVIDLGVPIRWDDRTAGERRGVVVRPNVVRIAHVQRSIYFGSSGSQESDQYKEAASVREAARSLFGPSSARTLLRTLLSTADQIAFCRFHRLWCGPFYSSNAGIDGEVIDFGSFRSLPTWRRFRGDLSAPAFGQEEQALLAAFFELIPTIEREGGVSYTPLRLQQAFKSKMTRSFTRECLSALNLQAPYDFNAEKEALKLMEECYVEAQKCDDNPEMVQLRNGEDDGFLPWSNLRAAVRKAYAHSKNGSTDELTSLSWLGRVSSRRRLLEREAMLRRTLRVLHSRRFSRMSRNDRSLFISRFVQSTAFRSRRLWPDLPGKFIVVDSFMRNAVHSVSCVDLRTNESFVWVEAPRYKADVWLDSYFPISDLGVEDLSSSPSFGRFLISRRQASLVHEAFVPYLVDDTCGSKRIGLV